MKKYLLAILLAMICFAANARQHQDQVRYGSCTFNYDSSWVIKVASLSLSGLNKSDEFMYDFICKQSPSSNFHITVPPNSDQISVRTGGCVFDVRWTIEGNMFRVNSNYDNVCTTSSNAFRIYPGMPKDYGSFYSYHAACSNGGSAWVNIKKNSPNIYAYSGPGGTSSEVGIGVEGALRRACGR